MSNAGAVLACALALLGRSASSMPPIEIVDVAPADASLQVEAFVRPPAKTIFVVASAPTFRAAMSSNARCDVPSIKKLASILAHEEWHILHGSDERSAYEAQLTTLIRIGVPPDSALYIGVVRSMLSALEARNERRGRLLVARR